MRFILNFFILFKSPAICIRLYCPDYGAGSPLIKIDYNDKEHSYTPHAIKTGQWVNLTVVSSASRLTVYFNGNPQLLPVPGLPSSREPMQPSVQTRVNLHRKAAGHTVISLTGRLT